MWPVLSLLATVNERRRAAEQGIKLLEKGVGPNKHQAAATGQLFPHDRACTQAAPVQGCNSSLVAVQVCGHAPGDASHKLCGS